MRGVDVGGIYENPGLQSCNTRRSRRELLTLRAVRYGGSMSERPLSERVAAPPTLELPHSTDEVTWRAATSADITGIHELMLESSAVDHPHYTVTREEIEDEFTASYLDATGDTIVAVAPDGTILGAGFVSFPPGQETLVRSILDGSVRPSARGRGIGRQLLAWQVARGQQQLASSDKTLPGWLLAGADEGVTDAISLFEREGLTVARYFLELRRDLAGPIVDVALDAAVHLEPLTPELVAPTLVARNTAFMDHWGSQPTSEEGWASFMGRSTTRGDLSSIAVAGDAEVAGFVVASVNEDDWPGQGFSSAYVDLVGVTRPWRKRGIAAALLTNTMRLAKAAGLDKVVLDVDAINPTGALGLYEGLGFEESNRSMSFTKVY